MTRWQTFIAKGMAHASSQSDIEHVALSQMAKGGPRDLKAAKERCIELKEALAQAREW